LKQEIKTIFKKDAVGNFLKMQSFNFAVQLVYNFIVREENKKFNQIYKMVRRTFYKLRRLNLAVFNRP